MEPLAVVFDLDYTLAVPRRDRQTLLDEATEAASVDRISRAEYLDAHGADLASETRAPIFEAILEEGDPAEVATHYRRAVEEALVPFPGVAELLADLGARYRLGLLTDGPTRAQYGKLETLGWADLFDAVVVTGDLPAGKPDPRTFATVLDELDASATEAVFVGDHPTADVQGAADAGFYVIQVLDGDAERSPAADATVATDQLAEDLRDLLLTQSRLP